MKSLTKKDIVEVLSLSQEEYQCTVASEAKRIHREENGDRLIATAMLGFSNICRNQCLYCGMRAQNKDIERYRLEEEQVVRAARASHDLGFRRIFLISGADPGYGFANILHIVERLKRQGFYISLALGALQKQQYLELKAAGADEYVLKFEMSQPEVFNRMKPTTSFDDRMQSIGWIQESGLLLASGSIVDYPGQTIEQLAEDLLLTNRLGVSWVPNIPYMPAKGTPLALEGGPGDVDINLRAISLLRLMMPNVRITAQQPGRDPAKGLADPEGNLNALAAGADMLFADMLSDELIGNFSVVDHRITLGLDHIRNMAEQSGMGLTFRGEPAKQVLRVDCVACDAQQEQEIRSKVQTALDTLKPALEMAGCCVSYTSRVREGMDRAVIAVDGELLAVSDSDCIEECVVKRLLEIVFDPPKSGGK